MDSKLFYKAMSGFYDLIDIVYSKDMLKIAQGKVKKFKAPNIKLYHMDATNMRFQDNFLQSIISTYRNFRTKAF